MVREDTYPHARGHLAHMTEAQLEERFWQLTGKIVDPLVDLARTHTSPSIERSVLMRMGIDSRTAMAVVTECETRRLLGHGAGHVVLHCAQAWDTDVVAAAGKLAGDEGWDTVEAKWGTR